MKNENRTIENTYRLTHPQLREWDKYSNVDKAPIKNIGAAVIVDHRAEFPLLFQAINEFIRRNDGIRLRMCEVDGEPRQYVAPYEVEEIDFFDFAQEDDPRAAFDAWNDSLFKEYLPLEHSKLYYFACFTLDDGRKGVMLKIHHIICDGWGVALIQRSIFEIYKDLLLGEETYPPVAPSYLDWIEKEDKYLNSKRCAKDKKYWLDKFSDIDHIQDVFFYKHTSAVVGQRAEYSLGADLTAELAVFLKDNKLSINTFFLAAMGLYLYWYTDYKDTLIGNLIFNRDTKADKVTMGLFVSKISSRVRVELDETVGEFLSRLLDEGISDLYHSKYPYDMLINDLAIKERGFTSLYRYSVNCYITSLDEITNVRGLESVESYTGCQNNSCQVVVKQNNLGHVVLSSDFKTTEYSAETIRNMHMFLKQAAKAMVDDKELKISDLLANVNIDKL